MHPVAPIDSRCASRIGAAQRAHNGSERLDLMLLRDSERPAARGRQRTRDVCHSGLCSLSSGRLLETEGQDGIVKLVGWGDAFARTAWVETKWGTK